MTHPSVATRILGASRPNNRRLAALLLLALSGACAVPAPSELSAIVRPEGYETLEEARMVAAYGNLPYGDDVPAEYGAILYVRAGKYFASAPIAGTRSGVRFLFGRKNGVAVTLEGDPIVELAHTHPANDSDDNASFSSARRSGELGDVGIAETYHINITLRYRNEIRIYEPARMKPPTDRRGRSDNAPGRSLCRAHCFAPRSE
jgi:hypothetical protein